MPPYISVSTYIQCPDDPRQAILPRFVELLRHLGYQGGDIEAWLADIHWPPEGDDLGGGLHPDAPLLAVEVGGQALRVLPVVSLWTSETIPGLPQPHIQLELAFDTHAEGQRLTMGSPEHWMFQYIPGVGRALWQVAMQMQRIVGDFPVWIEYEGFEDAWEAITAGNGQFWMFEAALVPYPQASRLPPAPDGYARADLPDGIGLAQKLAWPTLPWEETEMGSAELLHRLP